MAQSRLRVRLLGVAAACVLMLGALELTSLVLFRAMDGRSFSYARIAQEQAAEVAASVPPTVASAPGPDVAPAAPVGGAVFEGRPEKTPAELVPHPSRPPLSWSVTASLVWRRLDRWLAGKVGSARQDLETAPTRRAAYRERGPRRQYANDQEVLRDIARVWGLSSVQMQRLCAGARTRYYHFLQPNQYVPGSKPMGASERALAYRADHPYRSSVEQGYPLLRAEGARLVTLGIEFRDLSGLFETVSDPLYIDDCCHVNAKGNAMLGETIGAVVATRWWR